MGNLSNLVTRIAMYVLTLIIVAMVVVFYVQYSKFSPLSIKDIKFVTKTRTAVVYGTVNNEHFSIPIIVTEDEIYIDESNVILTHDMKLEKLKVSSVPDWLAPFRLGVGTPILDDEAKAFSRQRLVIGYSPVSLGRFELGALTDLHSLGVGVGYRTRNITLGGYYMLTPDEEVGLYATAKIF